MTKRRGRVEKPWLGRSPVPPPSRPMDKDRYDRKEEKREVERLIAEGESEVVERSVGASESATGGDVPRGEHPRPQMVRRDWKSLNGEWEFGFDDEGGMEAARLFAGERLPQRITVPFCFESRLGGIGDTSVHERVWYARDFEAPGEWEGGRGGVLLHFGAVDYRARVWVNGHEAGEHRGGQTPFVFDVTEMLEEGSGRVVVCVEDEVSKKQARGKQTWEAGSFGIFYTRVTGIWQTVWLERVGESYIEDIVYRAEVESGRLFARVSVARGREGQEVEARASLRGREVARARGAVEVGKAEVVLEIAEAHLWSVEEPNLYDVEMRLFDEGREADRVESYAGMREVSVRGNEFCINGEPYFQRLVLDQGYWPEGLWTAPTDGDLRGDIELAKSFGFNGARKHQKVEDPRYLYWADRLGFLVWGEMGNAQEWDEGWEDAFLEEWLAAVGRDRNHPSVVVWTPFNESWGIEGVLGDKRVQDYVRRVVEATREADPTRPVNDNDGWEHTGATDLLTVHDYEKTGEKLLERWRDFAGRAGEAVAKVHREALCDGVESGGWPFLLTEYGGIAYREGGVEGEAWGYHGVEESEEAFLERFGGLQEVLYAMGSLRGFCYTQLTDVEQEINGLATCRRRVKVEPSRIAAIVEGRKAN